MPSYPLIRQGNITLHSHTRNRNNTTNYKERIIVIDCTIIEYLPQQLKHPISLTEVMSNYIDNRLHMKTKKYNRPNQKKTTL